jgi:hypothetical protein
MLLCPDGEVILGICLIMLVLQPCLRLRTPPKLLFTPFPEEMLDCGPWFQQHITTFNACTIRVKNGDDKWETISYLSLYIMGYRWKLEENLWAADVADIGKLDAAAIIQHTPTATAEEKQFLLEDENLFHFHNACVHRQMQVTFSTAIIEAVRDHALFSELDIFDQTIGPLDLYQGSRLLWKLTELCVSHLRLAKKKIVSGSHANSFGYSGQWSDLQGRNA